MALPTRLFISDALLFISDAFFFTSTVSLLCLWCLPVDLSYVFFSITLQTENTKTTNNDADVSLYSLCQKPTVSRALPSGVQDINRQPHASNRTSLATSAAPQCRSVIPTRHPSNGTASTAEVKETRGVLPPLHP
jgi:hypothetical protein